MIFQWDHYLEFARELHSKKDEFPNEDARFRSVISRVYYSMFHEIKNHPWFVGTVPDGRGEGSLLVRELKNTKKYEKYKDVFEIGEKLDSLIGYRIHADYYSTEFNSEHTSETSIILADDIKKLLSSLKV